MASGLARVESLRSGLRVKVLDKRARPRWHELWDGNPKLGRPQERGEFSTIVNGPSARPYIDYARSNERRWAWKPLRPPPGEIFGIRPDQRGAGRILVEPTIKPNASPNKMWKGWDQFAALARAAGIRLAQMCPPGYGSLSGLERIETGTFRNACGVLAASDGIVTYEGGLHHAAAALGKPAVVIFGGYISPEQSGYETHTNLFTGGEACGWRVPCAHCVAAMQKITPEMVLQETELAMRKEKAA